MAGRKTQSRAHAWEAREEGLECAEDSGTGAQRGAAVGRSSEVGVHLQLLHCCAARTGSTVKQRAPIMVLKKARATQLKNEDKRLIITVRLIQMKILRLSPHASQKGYH